MASDSVQFVPEGIYCLQVLSDAKIVLGVVEVPAHILMFHLYTSCTHANNSPAETVKYIISKDLFIF
jgi:hypothetical protein